MQGVQPRPLRSGRQEREVRLLRLPVPPQAGKWHLRRPQAQRPPLRGAGGGQDSGERAHRVQHPDVGEAGGRGDGRGGKGAAEEAGNHRGGVGGREAQVGTALRPGGDHRPGHRRLQTPHTESTGSGRRNWRPRRRGQGRCSPSGGRSWTTWRPSRPTP